MANGDFESQHPLEGEMLTIAKLLIERKQKKFFSNPSTRVYQVIAPKTKHRTAKIVLRQSIEEAGVRSIQQEVERHMGDRIVDSLLPEQGGNNEGSKVQVSYTSLELLHFSSEST